MLALRILWTRSDPRARTRFEQCALIASPDQEPLDRPGGGRGKPIPGLPIAGKPALPETSSRKILLISDDWNDDAGSVNRLCTFGGAVVGSYLGWYLGLRWGMGLAFSLGAIGSLLGVYLGWKLAQRYA